MHRRRKQRKRLCGSERYIENKNQERGPSVSSGRATAWTLGDPLSEQAMGPFLNSLEQNMPDPKQVCISVAHSDYAGLFEALWGPGSLDSVKDVSGATERIVRSIAAYERSAEVNPFTSKFDLFYANANAAGKDITRITAAGIPSGMMGGGSGMGPNPNLFPNRSMMRTGL